MIDGIYDVYSNGGSSKIEVEVNDDDDDEVIATRGNNNGISWITVSVFVSVFVFE